MAPDEETDPMRRRTLLAGLTGIAGSSLLTSPARGAAPAGDPVGLLEHALLDPSISVDSPATLPQVRRAVATARSTFQHGRYAQVVAMLPDLLSTAIATQAEQNTGDDVAAANGQLSDLYGLTTELMIKLGNDHLAWTAADRAVQTGHASHDLLTQATARRVWAIVLRRAGRTDVAQRLVVDTAATLQPQLGQGPEHLSVYGTLLATAAYTAAGDGDRSTAHALIDEAVDAARALGVDANHRFTTFGLTRVRAYQIGFARVLGDYGIAIEHARQINHASISFAERRARYWADVARSYHGWNKPEQCFRALLAAERAAPDEVRYRKPIQHITADLLHHPTANKLPGLRAFANSPAL